MMPDSDSSPATDYSAVFARLRAHAPQAAATSAAQRLDKIYRLQQAVYDLRGEIAETGMREIGSDGRGQLIPLKPEVEDLTANLAKWMEREPAAASSALMGRAGYIVHQPKGVILHLSTWNAPILISLLPVMNMISAGNVVCLKPSEITPGSADLVARIVDAAGLEDDIAVVQGGPETAEALLKLPFNHICYVGNNRIGRLVMRAAAENFAGVTLEMGGKNPIIIAEDADLDFAAAKIVTGRLILNGQACLGPDYLLIDNRVRSAMTDKLVEKISAFYNPDGAGFRASRDLPRMINERHTLRVKALIDDALEKGARLVIGGEVDVSDRFISPTLLDNVTEDMDIFHEEVFGPVMTLHGFDKPADALREIDRRPSPLGLYVFTQSRETADWYIDHTRAGSSAINNIATQTPVPTIPFGGLNHSGIGRLGGHAGFCEFSNIRGVAEDPIDCAQALPAQYPPYPAEIGDFLDLMIKPDAPQPGISADAALSTPAPQQEGTPVKEPAMSAIDGTWDTVTKSPMGDQKGVFELKTEGNSLSGSSQTPMGPVEFKNGVVDGNNISWIIELKQPMPITLEGKATVNGDTLTGTVKMGAFGEFALAGTRRA
jgi:aldehyde dehydrogenase (NAD+)